MTRLSRVPKNIVPAAEFRRTGCEILVIGAGASGLTVALDLAASGARDVVVADHGPFIGFAHRSQAPAAHPAPAALPWWSSSSSYYSPAPGVLSPVGGRTRCWEGVVIPVDDALLAGHWPRPVVDALTGEGTGSYAGTLRELAEWRGMPLVAPQWRSERDLLERWSDVLPGPHLSVVPRAGRIVDGPSGRRIWAYSPLLAWQEAGLERHRSGTLPTVLHGLQAVRLTTSGERVTGARFRTSKDAAYELSADVVVLAAGTLENTRLYAQVHSGETVWGNLNDHFTHGIVVPLSGPVLASLAHAESAFLWSRLEREWNANLFVDIHSAGLAAPVVDIWWMAHQEAPAADSITFGAGPAPWPAVIDSRLSALDRALVARRTEYAAELLAKTAIGGVLREGAGDLADAIGVALTTRDAVTYGHGPGVTNHEAGTLPLGSRLGHGGRDRRFRNLFVAGPATFPFAGSANPTLTIFALAGQTAMEIAGGAW